MTEGGNKNEFWLLLAAVIAGLAALVLVLIYADKGNNPKGRMLRCSMGFLVSIVWIMAIADEVVNVLQVQSVSENKQSQKLTVCSFQKTFGFIFGLSDAIIGLTIFAMGNSLADLVANMSVAVS